MVQSPITKGRAIETRAIETRVIETRTAEIETRVLETPAPLSGLKSRALQNERHDGRIYGRSKRV